MIAPGDLKDPACVRKNTLLNVLDPGPVHSDRNVVLSLARHRAGMTPDALAVINYEAVFHPTQSYVVYRCGVTFQKKKPPLKY